MSDTPSRLPVLITGAGRNVGAHIAQGLLDAGDAVVAQFRSPTVEVDRLRAQGAHMIQADFVDADSIFTFIEALLEQHAELAGIIHNASAFAPTATGSRQAAAQFQQYFAVHMLAPFLINQALAPRLRGPRGRPADIIHITDIYSDIPSPAHDIYCATKAGLQNMGLSLARSLAPAVKVNIIQPGPIDFPADYDAASSQAILDSTPMARAGGAGVILQAVQSIRDNEFLNGAVIAVDGGRRLCRG